MHDARNTLKHKAFTLIELLAAIAIIAALTTASLYFVGGYVQYAQQNADKQTLTVLNDALTRYKCEGGNVAALTAGVPIGHVLAAMQAPLNWSGNTHSVLQSGVTYPARSLSSGGQGSSFVFYKYNSYDGYANGTVSKPTVAAYGGGVGYMSNGGTQAYNVVINTTSGFVAYKNAAGATAQHTQGTFTIPVTSSITFWSCASGSDPTVSGNITYLSCRNNLLTQLNVSGLTGITNLDCFNNSIASIDVSQNLALTILNVDHNAISSINVSNNTSLTSLDCASNSNISSLDVSALPNLQSLYCYNTNVSSINLSNNPLLQILQCQGNHLSSLDVSHNTVLTQLLCSGNGSISSLDVSHNTGLTMLIAWGNNLGAINATGCFGLPAPSTNGSTNFQIQGNPNPVVTGPIPYP